MKINSASSSLLSYQFFRIKSIIWWRKWQQFKEKWKWSIHQHTLKISNAKNLVLHLLVKESKRKNKAKRSFFYQLIIEENRLAGSALHLSVYFASRNSLSMSAEMWIPTEKCSFSCRIKQIFQTNNSLAGEVAAGSSEIGPDSPQIELPCFLSIRTLDQVCQSRRNENPETENWIVTLQISWRSFW